MVTKIHVNQHNIKYNAKHGTELPVFTVKKGKRNTYTSRIMIDGPSQLVYSDDGSCDFKQLSCGARCWIETTATVKCNEPMTYKQVMALKQRYSEAK